MKKVIVIETNQSDEKLKAAIQSVLQNPAEAVETIQLYPFNNHFRADYLDTYNEVQLKLSNDYEGKVFNAHQIVNIADTVAENLSNNETVSSIRSQLIEDALYKTTLK